MTRASVMQNYYPALDGLRGAGILAMLLYHLGVGLSSGAFLALSMFFTLSGYLIGGQLIAEHARSGRIALMKFWERRIRRLMPASTIALALALAYTAALALPEDVARFGADILAALFYVPNWRFIATGLDYGAIFDDPSPVQHFWSLGVEEQFYLAVPLISVAALSRGSVRRLAMVCALLIAASTAAMAYLRVPDSPLGHAYYGTDARAAEVLVGFLLAIWVRESGYLEDRGRGRAIQWAGAIALVTTFALWFTAEDTQLWFYRGGALANALVTSLVILSGLRPGPVTTLLSIRPLAYVGRISYGLYVYHWPIYLIIDSSALELAPATESTVKLAITFAVAALSHRYIEAPIRLRRAFVGPRRWIVPPMALASLAALALCLVVSNRDQESAMSEALQQPPLEAPSNDVGEADGMKRIYVIGDSTAKMIGVGLQDWGRETGLAKFSVQSFPGCGLLFEGEVVTKRPDQDYLCQAMTRKLPRWARFRPDIVVLILGQADLAYRRMDGWNDFRAPGDPDFDTMLLHRYEEVIDDFIANEVQVVLLTTPCAKPKKFRRLHERKGMFVPEAIHHYNRVLLPQLESPRSAAMSVVDLYGEVCPGGEFSQGLFGIADARRDGIHFTGKGGRGLANWLGPAILASAGEVPPPP